MKRAVVTLVVVLAVLVAAASASTAGTANARNDLIAFVSTSSGSAQLYTVRPDTTGLQQLTDDAAGVGLPQWSPDGKRLLILTGCSDVSGTCANPTGFAIMRPDGSHRVDIAGTRPVLSPNGKWLAYMTCSGTSCDLFVANANGHNRVLLDTEVRNHPFPPAEQAWSSDSKQVVYVKGGESVDESIWVADRRGGAKVEVPTGIPTGVFALVMTPVFFPADNTITFVADFPARLFSISIGDVQPTNRGLLGDSAYLVQSPTRTRLASQAFGLGPGGFIQVYNGDVDEFGRFVAEFRTPVPNSYDPVWSPDGSRIAYTFCDRSTTSFPGGPCSIQIVGPGSNPSIIYNGPAVEGGDWVRGYDWSPDSSALVLSVSESGSPFRLRVVNADGTGLTPLLSGSDDQYTPVWRP